MCEDSEFLKGGNLIDYSLLCSIHHFDAKDYDKVDENQKYRIIKRLGISVVFCPTLYDLYILELSFYYNNIY